MCLQPSMQLHRGVIVRCHSDTLTLSDRNWQTGRQLGAAHPRGGHLLHTRHGVADKCYPLFAFGHSWLHSAAGSPKFLLPTLSQLQ
jgi:hypothetical protein